MCLPTSLLPCLDLTARAVAVFGYIDTFTLARATRQEPSWTSVYVCLIFAIAVFVTPQSVIEDRPVDVVKLYYWGVRRLEGPLAVVVAILVWSLLKYCFTWLGALLCEMLGLPYTWRRRSILLWAFGLLERQDGAAEEEENAERRKAAATRAS